MSDEIKSPIDSILVDMIIEHFNQQSINGKKELLTGKEPLIFAVNQRRILFFP